jgi:hypothetical protein
MISVEVGDEDPDNASEVQALMTELSLCPFTTVHDEELITKLHDLRRRIMLEGRQSRATA